MTATRLLARAHRWYRWRRPAFVMLGYAELLWLTAVLLGPLSATAAANALTLALTLAAFILAVTYAPASTD